MVVKAVLAGIMDSANINDNFTLSQLFRVASASDG
jgi:hypothetical protein